MKLIKLFFLIIIVASCKTTKITKQLNQKVTSNFYDNQFTGILVVDAATKDTIFSKNATKYFTPASNTKIVTLYTALKLLPEKIPAFKYSINKDTISILGTGNPTFLHSYFKDSTVLKFIQNFKKVTIITANLVDDAFGAGWAWEDYDTYFSPERSSFPMYGNVLKVTNNSDLQCIPKIMKSNLSYSTKEKFKRKLTKNQFFYHPNSTKEREIPMIMNSLLVRKLWRNLLPTKVEFTTSIPKKMKTYYGMPVDSLYKRMMYKSDNFLAEQMLLLASSTVSDTLDSKKIRRFMLKTHYKNLKQKPRWVDGSGLSRYNLFTPTTFVEILTKLHDEIPKERLFPLFPIGRKDISSWYLGKEKQYVFAKSGYLSNNYNVSGYLVTNSGKTLIFSFMNNHYQKSTSELKKQMQTFFEYLRDKY